MNVCERLSLGHSAKEEVFRRMSLNILYRNHDDHTKKTSFLMAKDGTWSLAPAYDLVSNFKPGGQWTSIHPMCLNGKQDNFVWNDFAEVAKAFNIRRYKDIFRPNERGL